MLKIEALQNDSVKLKNVRDAIAFLNQVGVFEALRERLLQVSVVDPSKENAEHVASARMHSISGYNSCIEELLDLIAPVKAEIKDMVPDFGARDEMIKQGFSEEEITEALNNLTEKEN